MSNGNIFWNATERRLRALWRLLIQGIAWFALMFIGQGVIGAIWGILAVATGSVSLEELSDPAAATEFIMGQPGLVIGLQVVSLVAIVASRSEERGVGKEGWYAVYQGCVFSERWMQC